MDPSSSYVNHHQSNDPRYVPFSPPLNPPPPLNHPPASYQQSPNDLYPSRHHHHHVPPQPLQQLPPPPQIVSQQHQLYRPASVLPHPPQPRQQHPNHNPYDPHFPQFSFSPDFKSNSNPNTNNISHQFRDFPQRRVAEFDEQSDYWRTNRLSRPLALANLEREAHYHQFDRRPASPVVERFRHDREGSSRFRNIEPNQREREERGRVQSDSWISDRSSREFGVVSMGFESNSKNLAFDHKVTENVRWGSFRDKLIGNANNEIGERDEVRLFPRKIEYLRDSEAERFSERGSSGEGNHEFNRTPRKQIQKKSALLRIQKAKPNHRNREDERSHFSGYHKEGKTGTFRGKDSVLHSDHGMEEKEREGSPVELDVSFKSNSLVAKAIVTPNSATLTDSNAMPRNSKIRRGMVFDKDCSSLQPDKANASATKLDFSFSDDSKQSEAKVKSLVVGNVQDGVTKSCSKGANLSPRKGKFKRSSKLSMKLNDSSCVPEDAPVSGKQKEQFEGKGKIPSIVNVGDGVVQTSSNRVNVLAGESKVEGTAKSSLSDKSSASVGKQSSHKTSKKKRIVKKVVKKVANPSLNLGNSKSAKKGDQPVKAGASTHCPSATSVVNKNATALETKIATAAGDSVPGVDSECCTKELFEKEKVNGALKDLVSKESGTDVDPGNSVSHDIKRKRNCSTPPLDPSGHKETDVGQGSLNDYNSALDLHAISNVKEVQSDTPNENVTAGTLIVEDVNKQFYQDNNINYGLLRSEDCNVHEDIVNLGSSSMAMHTSSSSKCDSFTNQGINIACGINNTYSDCKHVCATPGSPLDKAGAAGRLLEANCSVGNNKIAHLPLLRETEIKNGSIPADCFDQERSTIPTTDIGNVISGEINHEIGDYFVRHLPPSTLAVGKSIPAKIPNHVESAQCKDECAADVHRRKAGITELDLRTSALSNISIGSADVLTPANVLNSTISTSDVNSNPPKIMAGNKLLDVGLQHSVSKVSILHGSSSNDSFPDISATANEKSPENKKRKISTSSSSVTVSIIGQEAAVSDIHKSDIQVPFSSTDDLLQLEKEVKVSSTDGLHTEGTELLGVNSSVVGPSQAVDRHKDSCHHDNPKIDHCAAFVGSVAPNSQCLNPLEVGGEKSSAVNNHQIDAMDIEGYDRREVHVDAIGELKTISSEVSWCKLTPEHTPSILDQKLPSVDVEYDNTIPLKDDLPSAFGGSDDETMPVPDILSGIGPPNSHDHLHTSSSTCITPLCQDKAYLDEKCLDDKPVIEGAYNSSTLVSYSQHSNTILKLNDGNQTNQPIAGKVGLLPSHGSKNTCSRNFISRETHGRKTQHSHVAPKSYLTRQSFVFPASKNTPSSTNITKPRTWRRTDNSSASLSGNKPLLSANSLQRQMPEAANFQSNSYVRKGNSLVRKPVSVPPLPHRSHSLSSSFHRSGVVDEINKGTGLNIRVDTVELRTGGLNTSFERPKTPPSSSAIKVPNCASNSSGECTSSPFAEPAINDCCETRTSSMGINDVLNSPEDGLKISETLTQNGSDNNLEHWNEQNESNLVLSNAKRLAHVNPKSNQLVAASDSGCASALNADKIQPFSASSDYYYKKSKNQLIRTATESHIKEAVNMSSDKSNSVGQLAGKVLSSRTFGKKRSNKAKTQKHSKLSMVWTLNGATLSHNDGNSPCCLKVLPQLFPWKRATYRKSLKLNSVSSCNNPLSTISGKMLQLRKRDTLYTRSNKGFSIQKSKVLSVGGSSLKWSKSIEKNSRKANEEATLAVAEAERKKREQNGTVSGTGKRSYSHNKVVCRTELRPGCLNDTVHENFETLGERIFRIGSMHYKMDSSRRSLQRISGDESSCFGGHQSENSTKISYVPRRLVIGNDEYVRIGNGNQLVRNPKKRTRVLASEKVRWSLHTARLRLIKKRKYCQFFTRFGKCNKDDGKCPYIHDPSKTAVCTKFLNGLCSNSNCKLTHKVIPERMPDCSYFLQGLCTNENCRYRHVYVNPNASTCEGFLRGYCPDGNECRKKHSYVCPDFEARGSCPQGSKCKLHHPKKHSKGKKRKRSMGHKNGRGRYFGINALEPKRMVSKRHQGQVDNEGFFDGEFSEYISLDVSDDEAREIHLVRSDEGTFGDNDSSDLGLDDLDELIKPIRIMNK